MNQIPHWRDGFHADKHHLHGVDLTSLNSLTCELLALDSYMHDTVKVEKPVTDHLSKISEQIVPKMSWWKFYPCR